MNLNNFILNEESTLYDGLKKIEENKKGFLIIVDQKMRVQGTLTDGDIRRSLLKNSNIYEEINSIMRINFSFISMDSTFDKLINLFKSSKIDFLPIIDNENKLVNLLTKKQFHAALLQGIKWDYDYDFSTLDELIIDHEIYNRPWGYYKTVFLSDYTRAKIIHVNPNEELSLQEHKKREEHWVIIKGKGKVIIGESEKLVEAGLYMYIPKGCKHKVINTSHSEPLMISEVQLGNYFGEDDIIRYDDKYGRLEK